MGGARLNMGMFVARTGASQCWAHHYRAVIVRCAALNYFSQTNSISYVVARIMLGLCRDIVYSSKEVLNYETNNSGG